MNKEFDRTNLDTYTFVDEHDFNIKYRSNDTIVFGKNYRNFIKNHEKYNYYMMQIEKINILRSIVFIPITITIHEINYQLYVAIGRSTKNANQLLLYYPSFIISLNVENNRAHVIWKKTNKSAKDKRMQLQCVGLKYKIPVEIINIFFDSFTKRDWDNFTEKYLK